MKSILIGLATASFMLVGCASTPQQVPEVDDARVAIETLEREPLAQTVASAELADAQQALDQATMLLDEREPLDRVKHQAYVAKRNAEIGMQVIAEAEALEQIEKAKSERQEVLLQARTVEAERAEALADQRAIEAQESAAIAAIATATADAAIDEANRLADELSELESEVTERGLVFTLNDVLFDTNGVMLKPGAKSTMERLAAFLATNPERHLLIEGHTDSRGSSDFNQELSEKRAAAVKSALVSLGVERNRLETVGLGEEYPIATNDSTAGMQQNRRVEIVLSDAQGAFPATTDRQAASEG